VRLATAANVLVPCILLLEERGYVVTLSRTGNAEHWTAKRGATELVGNDPIELLAIATLSEARGASWRAPDEEVTSTLARFGIA
jgi:hypothetical protein